MSNFPENIAGSVLRIMECILKLFARVRHCFSNFTVGSSKTRQITIRGVGLNTTNHDMKPIGLRDSEWHIDPKHLRNTCSQDTGTMLPNIHSPPVPRTLSSSKSSISTFLLSVRLTATKHYFCKSQVYSIQSQTGSRASVSM